MLILKLVSVREKLSPLCKEFIRLNYNQSNLNLYLNKKCGFFWQADQSTETEIILRSVDLDTTGLFRCEISGEAPLFQTAYREAVMAVVGKYLPLTVQIFCLTEIVLTITNKILLFNCFVIRVE